MAHIETARGTQGKQNPSGRHSRVDSLYQQRRGGRLGETNYWGIAMSAFQTLIAGAFVIGVPKIAIDGIDKIFDGNESPIQVHSLRYENGLIYHDRTIEVDGKAETFALIWVAKLVDESGDVVRHCT